MTSCLGSQQKLLTEMGWEAGVDRNVILVHMQFLSGPLETALGAVTGDTLAREGGQLRMHHAAVQHQGCCHIHNRAVLITFVLAAEPSLRMIAALLNE